MRTRFVLPAAVVLLIYGVLTGACSAQSAQHCSSFVLDTGGPPVFCTNCDHVSVYQGLVFINKKGITKVGLMASTTGRYARWKARYASITFNLVGFQFAWAGMNDQGLTLSTMSLDTTEQPAPDGRPPLDSGMWMQFILDTCASVDEVIATDSLVRITTVDHYLVADRQGRVATIEFIDGEMVVHTGNDLPVCVLTNTTYAESVEAWLRCRGSWLYNLLESTLHRFCLAADQVDGFDHTDDETTVTYAFNVLEEIRGERFSHHSSQWSIVFDTNNLRAYFRTLKHPDLRYVDLMSFDLRCGLPEQMLDIQEELSGDVGDLFFDFSFDLNFEHMRQFMDNWGIIMTDTTMLWILRRFERYRCEHLHQPKQRLHSISGIVAPWSDARLRHLRNGLT